MNKNFCYFHDIHEDKDGFCINCAKEAVIKIEKLHKPNADFNCQECSHDWPCQTIENMKYVI